jgi:hypothetical protein
LLLGADGALLAALLPNLGTLAVSWLFQLFSALRRRKPYFATAYCAACVKAATCLL